MSVDGLLVTGTMGAGKTSVLGEASDILTEHGIAHAAIDLDALGIWNLPSASDDLMFQNLAAVWRNYAAAGVPKVLIAGAVENAVELGRIHRAVPDVTLTIVRLRASVETMRARVRMRETGVLRATYEARVDILDDILNRASLEAFAITNEDRAITEVARELLVRAGWLLP
jgi:hypothetical protein